MIAQFEIVPGIMEIGSRDRIVICEKYVFMVPTYVRRLKSVTLFQKTIYCTFFNLLKGVTRIPLPKQKIPITLITSKIRPPIYNMCKTNHWKLFTDHNGHGTPLHMFPCLWTCSNRPPIAGICVQYVCYLRQSYIYFTSGLVAFELEIGCNRNWLRFR